MEVAELECASGVPGGAGSFKAAADCLLVFSNPDGVCVRGPWILSADCPQTAKEARSRGKVRAALEAEEAGLTGIEEVGGAFELRSDVCSINLRLHRLEDIFTWLKRPIYRCFIPTKRVGQFRCVQA